jgi:hypothetical protein
MATKLVIRPGRSIRMRDGTIYKTGEEKKMNEHLKRDTAAQKKDDTRTYKEHIDSFISRGVLVEAEDDTEAVQEAGFTPTTPGADSQKALKELPLQLASITDVAQLEDMKKNDTRKGADKMYDARIAELRTP